MDSGRERIFMGDKIDDPPRISDPNTIEQKLRILLAPDRTYFVIGAIPPRNVADSAFGPHFSLPRGAQMIVGNNDGDYVPLPTRVCAEWVTGAGRFEVVADETGDHDRYNTRITGPRIDVWLDNVSADDIVDLLQRLRFLPGPGSLTEPGS